jgi:pyruvate/2-oxoglutarate dehydrogenase complex dihydrolipoamide acyltransferase (E2) component
MGEFPVRVPKVSMAIEEATLVQHLVEDSKPVNDGDGLFVVETDKVETEIEAPTSGVVHWTAEVGEIYAVGTQIGYIETID